MVDYMHLLNIGCHENDLRIRAVQSQNGGHTLMNFCTVVNSAAGKDNTYLCHDFFPPELI